VDTSKSSTNKVNGVVRICSCMRWNITHPDKNRDGCEAFQKLLRLLKNSARNLILSVGGECCMC
jgi:hypothetical protein